MLKWKHGLAALALGALTGTALAQVPAQPRDPNMPDPKTVPAEKMRPEEPGATGSTGQTLSDKLERTEGVIRPPAMPGSSDMVVRPPQTGSPMPVITPPGTSPSDPVQPK
jgi:hypothetical protein